MTNGGRSQRVRRLGNRAPHASYLRHAKLNAGSRRDFGQGWGKAKLIAETAFYSLLTLSPTELIVGRCDRPDTFACASAWYNAARSVRSPQRARKDLE